MIYDMSNTYNAQHLLLGAYSIAAKVPTCLLKETWEIQVSTNSFLMQVTRQNTPCFISFEICRNSSIAIVPQVETRTKQPNLWSRK
jgi:hypothetical protein